jgi:hypothetical protein
MPERCSSSHLDDERTDFTSHTWGGMKKSSSIALLVALCLLNGCGGGSAAPTPTAPINLVGTWNVVFSGAGAGMANPSAVTVTVAPASPSTCAGYGQSEPSTCYEADAPLGGVGQVTLTAGDFCSVPVDFSIGLTGTSVQFVLTSEPTVGNPSNESIFVGTGAYNQGELSGAWNTLNNPCGAFQGTWTSSK